MVHFRLLYIASVAAAADFYVSPKGSGSGSKNSPFGSIQDAVDAAEAGDTIYLRGGTFSPSKNIQITDKSGTASAPITITAYNGESVVIDGEDLPYTPAALGEGVPNSDRGIFHIQDAHYWKFYNLELINGPYGIFSRDASNNYYERISTHDNYETGFQIQGEAPNNQVIYLDSYRNRDPRKNGESADGLGIKEGSGEGIVVQGARLWENVDDGLDFWEFKSGITVVDTISWGNGFNRWGFSQFEGDGNGFKLGGGGKGDKGDANHSITNSIAFKNAAKGFTDNHQPGSFTLFRNTAWNNAEVGFQTDTSSSTFKKNIAAENNDSTKQSDQISLSDASTSGNSWQSGGKWTDSSFKSTDTSLVTGARSSDGKIKASDFLLPANGDSIGATTHWN